MLTILMMAMKDLLIEGAGRDDDDEGTGDDNEEADNDDDGEGAGKVMMTFRVVVRMMTMRVLLMITG